MRRPTEAAGGGTAGFNLIEVLVATAILFIVAIGVIPLFSRALIANKAGADATTVSHHGLSRLEQLIEPPFDSPPLTPATVDEFFSKADAVWKLGAAPPADDPGFWTRNTTITQHSLDDLIDDGVLDNPLDVGTDPTFVHLKLIEVDVSMVREEGNPLGRRRDLDLRTIRPF